MSNLPEGVVLLSYESEEQLPAIEELMAASLSEPYSVYTYRFFIHGWPKLTWRVRLLLSSPPPPCPRHPHPHPSSIPTLEFLFLFFE